jgi:hypothetical protein
LTFALLLSSIQFSKNPTCFVFSKAGFVKDFLVLSLLRLRHRRREEGLYGNTPISSTHIAIFFNEDLKNPGGLEYQEIRAKGGLDRGIKGREAQK